MHPYIAVQLLKFHASDPMMSLRTSPLTAHILNSCDLLYMKPCSMSEATPLQTSLVIRFSVLKTNLIASNVCKRSEMTLCGQQSS